MSCVSKSVGRGRAEGSGLWGEGRTRPGRTATVARPGGGGRTHSVINDRSRLRLMS